MAKMLYLGYNSKLDFFLNQNRDVDFRVVLNTANETKRAGGLSTVIETKRNETEQRGLRIETKRNKPAPHSQSLTRNEAKRELGYKQHQHDK
jgi:hypothetical protein